MDTGVKPAPISMGGEMKKVMDLYMVTALAAIFGLFYAFAGWCEHVVDDKGGE